MFKKIISFSLQNKPVVLLGTLALAIWGGWSAFHIPLDAVPDITNNQVQVVTSSPSLATQEVEQFITYPLEISLANVPGVSSIRSVSKFGLSVITVVFEDDVPVLEARQLVAEQLNIAAEEIPPSMGRPEMMPITTGLGEIFQYTLEVEPEFRSRYGPMELRSIQDWLVKRQLSGIPGIVEVSSFGGFLKQYEVAVDPRRLAAHGLTLEDLLEHLEKNNANSGGSYVEEGPQAVYIRSEGRLTDLNDLRKIPLPSVNNMPLTLGDVAEVRFGSAPRYGAITRDGRGETVGGITLMLKGANSSDVIDRVEERILSVQQSLPEGVYLAPYLNRSELVGRTIRTVVTNLTEGGLIVIFVLVLLLGNLRAGLVVASVIPLAMLFALGMMKIFGVSANLMSLGAIDFGIVVDGAVIVVEGALHLLHGRFSGQRLTRKQMDVAIGEASGNLYSSAAFGVLIIVLVFVPILTLTGVEGKMFIPMAQTVTFALLGAFLLSLTYVPVMSSLVFKKQLSAAQNFSDRLIQWFQDLYLPVLRFSLRRTGLVILLALGGLAAGVWGFSRLGAEFIPELEEGDLALQMSLKPGSSLAESVRMTTRMEAILLKEFPEVEHVVSKIGTAEVPTDPMSIEDADVMVIMKPRKEWITASSREEMVELMKKALEHLPLRSLEFSQPIQLRFNELLTGSKSDVSVKIFGEDPEKLVELGKQAEALIAGIPGAADVKLEQTEGLQQWVLTLDREQAALYGVDADQVNRVIRAAYSGLGAGLVYEGEQRYEAVVRLRPEDRAVLNADRLFVRAKNGELIPLSAVTTQKRTSGPSQVSRENTRRRIGIGVNVRDRDLESLVLEIEETLGRQLQLPPGYTLSFGGDFENLQRARSRLVLLMPVILLLILFLLYLALGSLGQSLLVFSAIPLSALGGIAALAVRGMPFSISAGVGFIALFGVAVLNGIVLVSSINRRRKQENGPLHEVLERACADRLRPVIMTAAVAALGFLPMALSTGAGAEVQKPLATVVIGGLVSATFLTLVVLPVLYQLFMKRSRKGFATLLLPFLFLSSPAQAQSEEELWQQVEKQHPEAVLARLRAEGAEAATGAKWDLGPTTFQYQYGQMNAANRDRYISFEQDFGSLLGAWKRGELLELQAEQAHEQMKLDIRRLRLAFRLDYQQYRYAARRLEVVEDLQRYWEDQMKTWDTQFRVGEINRSDFSLARSRLLELEHQYRRAAADAAASGSRMRIWLGADSLSATGGEWLLLDPALGNEADLLGPAQKTAEVNQKMLEQRRAQWFPELSAGYFNQQIEGIPGFTGWWLGLQVPLFSATGKAAAVSRAKLEAEAGRQELELQQRKATSGREAAFVRWKQLAELLPSLEEMRENARILYQDARRRLAVGEISVLEYSQWLDQAGRLEQQALQLQLEYNQSVLELNYYHEEL